jgi:hypothetical protein
VSGPEIITDMSTTLIPASGPVFVVISLPKSETIYIVADGATNGHGRERSIAKPSSKRICS